MTQSTRRALMYIGHINMVQSGVVNDIPGVGPRIAQQSITESTQDIMIAQAVITKRSQSLTLVSVHQGHRLTGQGGTS